MKKEMEGNEKRIKEEYEDKIRRLEERIKNDQIENQDEKLQAVMNEVGFKSI